MSPVSAQGAAQAMLKKYEGPTGSVLRMFGEVTATGTLTLPDETKLEATCSNGGSFSENWPSPIMGQWNMNHNEVEKKKKEGKKVPFPDKDAEALVVDGLIGQIRSKGKQTNGGTLSLSAHSTDICKYCKRLVRAFCKHYGLTWSNDPKL